MIVIQEDQIHQIQIQNQKMMIKDGSTKLFPLISKQSSTTISKNKAKSRKEQTQWN